MRKTKKNSLIGFFPSFGDIGETYPLVKIAECYRKLGGSVVFFSHGGKYEFLAEKSDFKIIRIDPVVNDEILSTFRFIQSSDEDIINIISNETQVFNQEEIKALVQSNMFFGSILASKIANIPCVSVVSGTITSDYYKSRLATYPDEKENSLTILTPRPIKNMITNWFALYYKEPILKKVVRISKVLNIDLQSQHLREILFGDHTLITDDINFLGIKKTEDIPLKNFVGPILPPDNLIDQQVDSEIENHLGREEKSILLTMGSTKSSKDILLKILNVLNNTEYVVIANYTTILNKDELPELGNHILLRQFFPDIKSINQMVDLAVIHGGRGTVYSAAYSGKPVIGVPNHSEQQGNLDCLVRHGCAIRLSKKNFNKEQLLNAIAKILDNYYLYLEKAQQLKNVLPKPEGDKKAAIRLMEIISGNDINI